ncbi:MAG: recombination-associated protein RdgC [Victivallaceae bacterium]|nr:recombination-associated protein RdgC [Victivallaceae bacterium]
MPFEHGTFTLAAFDLPGELPEDLLSRFAAHKAGALDDVGDEPQIGWVAGRHLLDTDFNGEGTRPGGCYYVALRQAVKKVPSSLLKALCRREECSRMAAYNKTYIKSKERREIKQEIVDKYLTMMPPTLSGIPCVIDPIHHRVYVGAASRTQLDLFVEQFYSAIGVDPIQIGPERWMNEFFESSCSSLPALRTTLSEGEELQTGRDFLMYLWHFSENVQRFEAGDYGEFELRLDAPLVFSGDGEADGSGEAVVKKGINPASSVECKAAAEVGKKLRKATLKISRGAQVWKCAIDADQFVFSSVSLPESEELDDSERFADRMEYVDMLITAVTELFRRFASELDEDAEKVGESIRNWIHDSDGI